MALVASVLGPRIIIGLPAAVAAGGAGCVDLMGADALIGDDDTSRRPGDLDRNIIGEQVLCLPGEPQVDKSVPWNEVPRNGPARPSPVVHARFTAVSRCGHW